MYNREMWRSVAGKPHIPYIASQNREDVQEMLDMLKESGEGRGLHILEKYYNPRNRRY